MAEQRAQSIGKFFENVAFPSVEDKYAVTVQFAADSQTLSLKFMNRANTKTFQQTFNKADVDKITVGCRLSVQNLCEVITDQLLPTEFIAKCCRVFVFGDMTQAMKKSEMYAQANEVPAATAIADVSGADGNDDGNNEGKVDDTMKQKGALLFVAHFNPSKYVRCNYCFVIPEKHLSDMDRFMIQFNELQNENQLLNQKTDAMKNENKQLKQQLDAFSQTLQQIQQQQNTLNPLKQKVSRLETGATELKQNTEKFSQQQAAMKNENQQLKQQLGAFSQTLQKIQQQVKQQQNTLKNENAALKQKMSRLETGASAEEINLNLINSWVKCGTSTPKAVKLGKVVSLSGLVTGGQASTVITQLPAGRRPSEQRVFGQAQDNSQASRVDVNSNGNVQLSGQFTSWVSLDGIQFTVA